MCGREQQQLKEVSAWSRVTARAELAALVGVSGLIPAKCGPKEKRLAWSDDIM